MTFAQRRVDSDNHEANVLALVAANAWNVCQFGQGQLSPEVRDALRRIDTPVRWLPDLLAVRGDAAYLIDAKWTNRHDTGFYDIEWSSLVAHDDIYRCLRLPVAYVWYDLAVSFTWEMLADGAPLHRGRWNGSGSGTPFRLWPKDRAHPFDDVFGIGAAVFGPTHHRMSVLRSPAGT